MVTVYSHSWTKADKRTMTQQSPAALLKPEWGGGGVWHTQTSHFLLPLKPECASNLHTPQLPS